MPMATNAPMRMIHIGRLEGRLKPNSSPVRMAEPSVIVTRSRFQYIFRYSPLEEHAGATDVANTIAAPNPKKYNEVSRAGMSAIHTPYIFLCTLSRPCTWGDSDTINFFAIIFLFYFALRARMRAITVVLPIRILSNIGRVEGQVTGTTRIRCMT